MKKNFIRTISLVLALVMSFSLMTTAFAAETDVDTDNDDLVVWYDADGNIVDFETPDDAALVTSFKDVKSSAWYYKDVTECAKLGIVAGFEDGTFKPENQVTSVQLLTMLTRTFYASKLDQVTAPKGSAWYYANTKVAADVGMSNGMKAIDDKPINRYEMALVLYNTMVANNKKATSAQKTNAINTIKDYKSIPTSPTNYRPAVQNCYGLGIITGMSDGTFSGAQNMTRAQACTVIMRMLKLINNYNPGDKDNDQYDDGKNQNTGNDQNQNTTGTLANGKPATVENVQAILEEIRREYPTGTPWGPSGTANNNYYTDAPGTTQTSRDVAAINANHKASASARIDLKYGCGGWAAMVSERIFGKTGAPGRLVTTTDVSKLRPGDIVFDISPKTGYCSHVSIVYKVEQVDGQWRFAKCAGNINSKVSWIDSLDSPLKGVLSNENVTRYVYTRYPA